jgi:hypothetical protein
MDYACSLTPVLFLPVKIGKMNTKYINLNINNKSGLKNRRSVCGGGRGEGRR